MSSIRNAVQRRSHRERAQPHERQRLGLLEKHKDYKLRAQDHNRKKTQIKSLRQKAADRNEDEFYFGMLSRSGPGSRLSERAGQGSGTKRWKGIVAGDRGNAAMSVDTVRLLKTQDVGYVRTVKSVVAKQVERLREQVVFAAEGVEEEEGGEDDDDDEDQDDEEGGLKVRGGASKFGTGIARPKKIVFVDPDEPGESAARGNGLETGPQGEDEDGEDDGEFEGFGDDNEDKKVAEAERKAKNLSRLRAELKVAETKLKTLREVERDLEVQQAKMAKTATSGGTTRKGKKMVVRARKR